jgi:hypothetical protein
LQEDQEIVEEEEAPELEPVDRPKSAPLPSWLKDDLGGAGTEDEGEAVPGEIPDWLQPPPDMIDTGLERAELPTWLVPPEDSDGAAPDLDLAAEMPLWPGEQREASLDEEGLGLAEAVIPDWLQALKPQEDPETETTLPSLELEKVETEGPLTGVRGALAIEGAIITTPETRPLPKFVVTEQQHDHVSVLKQIIHGGPEPKPEPAPVRTPQWWLERGLIPILVLAAVFVPALLGYWEQPLSIPEPDQARSEVLDMYDEIERLDSTDTVIVAFDYSPAAAGELDAVAEPLLRHIIDRGARILAVSTVPAGPQLALGTLQRIEPEAEVEPDSEDAYVYGQDYLILGYIPGGAVGLQAFATEPWELFSGPDFRGQVPLAQENEAASGLGEDLDGAELILLLTASRDDLIGWMEQVGRLPDLRDVPIVGGLSAGLEPWARPYYRTNGDYEPDEEQLSGLVVGVPAAVEYARRLGLEETSSVTLLRDSQVAGLAVVTVFVVIGLIWGSMAGLSSRSRRNG